MKITSVQVERLLAWPSPIVERIPFMSRLIVQNRSDLSDDAAMFLAYRVVSFGRISADGESYCYVSEFPLKSGKTYVVVARKNEKSDTFYVYNDGEA